MNEELKVLRISGKSPTKETAGSIVKTYDSGFKNIELRAIGASSVSQMAKSIATASSIFASKGLSLTTRLGYDKVALDGDKTVIIARLIIQ
ncbi:MAG: stage V sporulation protein S [Cellulosilyticum sp.]|nr:stage V sporulation protein S [Cellulosilyticum sp.]